jgi:hypothetical protein
MRYLPTLAKALLAATALLLASCQSQHEKLPAECQLKPESGRCRAAIERYWYDPQSESCKAFVWGGCGGVVPFETLQDCQRTCNAPATDQRKRQQRTLSPASK